MRIALLLLLAPFALALPGEPSATLPVAAAPTAVALAPAPPAPAEVPAPPPPKPWSLPADAVDATLAYLLTVPQQHWPFLRAVWVQDSTPENFKAVSDALNKASRGSVIRRPILTPSGIVAVIDLRWYFPRDQDIVEGLALWELLAFDPMFSLLITADTIKLLTQEQRADIRVPVSEIVWEKQGAKWIDTGRREVKLRALVELKDVQVVRLNADHLARSGIEKLQAATGSLAPVVNHHYLVGRILSTIQDKDGQKESVFSTLYGGLYYRFAGIRKATAKGATDLDQLLADLGIGNVEQNLTFERLFDRLRSDERAVLFRSDVTGKPRIIVWFSLPSSRPSTGAGIIFITLDLRDRDIDVLSHPIANLLNEHVAAYEVLWLKANGEQGMAIFNDKQALLDEAAAEVVVDRTVPAPYPTRLQPGQCFRCHGIQSDGWQPFANDAKTLLGKSLDVFGDTSQLDRTTADSRDRIMGLYSGDAGKPLRRARDDLAEATLRATGPWKQSKDQADVVRLGSAALARVYAADRYDLVDAAQSLRELGEVPTVGREVEQLNALLPPEQPFFVVGVGPIYAEDFRLGGLKAGLKIRRSDWDLAYNFALTRADRHRRKEQPK